MGIVNKVKKGVFNIGRSVLITLNPRLFDRLYYRLKLGRRCNLRDPRRLSEKIIWLKHNWYDARAEVYADKYAVRQLLQERGYGALLIPLIGVYSSIAEFDFDALPESFVLKAAHGSGMNLICWNKKALQRADVEANVKRWLKANYYYQCAEKHYRPMPKRVVCEELLVEPGRSSLTEYKIMCYNGSPQFVMVYYDRSGDSALSCCYDTEWNKLPVYSGKFTRGEREIPRPEQFSYMLEIARDISTGFPLMRVDIYEVGGQVYFGEMTFFHNAGVCCFTPDEYDTIFGEGLALSGKDEKSDI